ncbi:MAG: hypothetical protein WC621_01900 [Patescibacteria group bacterium]
MELSFIPATLLAYGLAMFLLIWWNKRHRIKFQPYCSYNLQNEEDEESTTDKNTAVNSTTLAAAEDLSSSPPPTSDEEELDELYIMDTPKVNEEDKNRRLNIILEEQDYLDDLAGRKTVSKISIKDILRALLQNRTVKIVLLIIGALTLFTGLVALTIITGRNSWFG